MTLQATGYDPEDGGLDSQSFEWTSDRDGALGTGGLVIVNDLFPGEHHITLQAEDSDGNLGSASVVMRVAPLCTGDCNDNGAVTVEELVKGVNIALGAAPMSECRAFDSSGDDGGTVDKLVQGVNHALSGCPTAELTTAPTAAAPSWSVAAPGAKNLVAASSKN